MLKWMYDATRLDKIRNQCMRGSVGVKGIAGNMRENRRRWYTHV